MESTCVGGGRRRASRSPGTEPTGARAPGWPPFLVVDATRTLGITFRLWRIRRLPGHGSGRRNGDVGQGVDQR